MAAVRRTLAAEIEKRATTCARVSRLMRDPLPLWSASVVYQPPQDEETEETLPPETIVGTGKTVRAALLALLKALCKRRGERLPRCGEHSKGMLPYVVCGLPLGHGGSLHCFNGSSWWSRE